MRISITAKLVIFVLILSLIATYAIGKYSYEKAKTALVQRTFDQLTSLRIEKTNRIESFFRQCKNDIYNISRVDDTRNLIYLFNYGSVSENDSCLKNEVFDLYNKYLKGYIEARKCYSHIYVMNEFKVMGIKINREKGEQICFVEKPVNPVLMELQSRVKSKNDFVIWDLTGLNEIEEPIIYIALRVVNENDDKDCFVALEIPIANISSIMLENSQYNGLGKSGETYLVGSDFLMRSSSRFQNNSVFKTKVDTKGVRRAFNGQTATGQILDYRNISVLSSFSTIKVPDLNWAVLAEIDTEEAMVPIYSIKNNIMYLTFIIFLLLLGVVALFTSMITAPIRALISKTDKVAQGEYGTTLNYSANDEVGDLVGAFNKMTTQLKLQSQKLENERLLRLTSLIDGQELERQRLSKDLHDGLGQLILASKLKFERALSVNPEKARQIIIETEELFKKTMVEIRNISNGLMPAVLTQFGLHIAISNLSKELTESTGMNIVVNTNLQSENIGKRRETYLYRIVQESLNNVVKHARARKVVITLIENEGDLLLSIKDNGIGIPIDAVKNGNGLNNMKDRATLLGSELEIISKEGSGTEIRLLIKNFENENN